MTRGEEVLLAVCCTVGAVVGLSLPGGAALGAVVGAAVGISGGWLLRGHRWHHDMRANAPGPRRSRHAQ